MKLSEAFKIRKRELELVRDPLPQKVKNANKLDLSLWRTCGDWQLFEMK